MNNERKVKYETLSAKKTTEQKFWHVNSIRALGMFDDVVTLLSNLGWMEYVEMNCVYYDYLIIEVLGSLNVNWVGSYRGQVVLISFRTFNMDHRMSLREFKGVLQLSVYPDSFRDVPSRWRSDLVWLSITCSKRKSYTGRFGHMFMALGKPRPRIFAMSISVITTFNG